MHFHASKYFDLSSFLRLTTGWYRMRMPYPLKMQNLYNNVQDLFWRLLVLVIQSTTLKECASFFVNFSQNLSLKFREVGWPKQLKSSQAQRGDGARRQLHWSVQNELFVQHKRMKYSTKSVLIGSIRSKKNISQSFDYETKTDWEARILAKTEEFFQNVHHDPSFLLQMDQFHHFKY